MLARSLYSLLLYLCLPLALGYFAYRSLREPDYRRGWAERLGFGRINARGGIWLHAASVGEVQAAVPLVTALAERYPDHPLLVTVFTPTGRERARAQLADVAQVRYLPFDVPGAVRRFLRQARPRAGLIVETEIWPNLLAHCRKREVPIMFVNGRLSARSARHYANPVLQPLMGRALAGVTRVAAASAEDAQRFIDLGVPASSVANTGNLKFDLSLSDEATENGQTLRREWQTENRPVWVAASTHEGEEPLVLDAFERLRTQHPDLLLVLVPRHPQRFETVAGLLEQRAYHFARRSLHEPVTSDCAIVLGDTLGELLDLYAAADLTLVGGTLVEGIGGHNLLEPAALQLPMLVGRYTGGWENVATLLEHAGALQRTTDPATIAQVVAGYLDDPARRQQAGGAAKHVVTTHSGALERTLQHMPALLEAGSNN